MWILLAILLFLLFGGLGFVLHILWVGLILVLIVLVVRALLNNRSGV